DLGNLDAGEGIAVQVEISNAVYKDLSAYVVDAANIGLARQGAQFRYIEGAQKRLAPFHMAARVAVGGPYYLVLDNRYAALIEKKVTYQLGYLKTLSEDQIRAQKAVFEKMYAALKGSFVFTDFNIHLKSCGQVNAFSANATGDVTICSEIAD